jgi:predicted chitinase
MADYNPNTLAAYQQYGQSMMAGGGGRNMSGLGARTSTSSMTTAPSGAVDFTTIDTKTGTQKKVATIDYGSDNDDGPISPTVIYAAAANAATEAGTVFAPTGPTANAMNLYSMPNMAPAASDYVYRADRDDAITSAIRSTQQEEQASVDAAISSINRAITLGKTDEEIAEAFLNDMGGFGNDKPDPLGGFGVPGVTLKDVTGTDEGALSNPQPLYDFAEEMRNPSITVEELPPMSPDEQASLGAAIRKAAEEGTLSSKLTNIQFVRSDGDRTDPSYWASVLFPDDVNEEGEQIIDVSPAAEAPDQQGLMSRPAPAVEAEAPAETTTRTNDVVDTALTKLSDNTSMSKSDIVSQVKDLVGRNIYTAAILGAFEKESGRNFTNREENLNYSLANARAVPFSKTKIDNALNSLSEADRAKVEAGRNVEAFGKALMDESYSGGSDYKGRGLIHITHDYNYEAVGDRIGVDLVSNPELVNDPKYAVPAALAYLDLQGYFDQEPTKNSLHRMINPQASRTIKNQRWSAANRYLEQIRDEGGSSDSSPRPMLRPTE